MKRYVFGSLCLCLIFALCACGKTEVPPSVDMGAAVDECVFGTVTEVYTEGGGADLARVISVDVKDRGVLNLTVTDDTELFMLYADTQETVSISYDDVYTGAYVRADIKSFQNSGYHPITAITLYEKEDPALISELLIESPPSLTVIGESCEIEALRGTYSWHYDNGDGTQTEICADSAHPLQCKEFMTPFILNFSAGSSENTLDTRLQFQYMPDSVTVRCWSSEYWDVLPAPTGEAVPVNITEVDFENDSFSNEIMLTLKDGVCIYEVTATWDRFSKFGGTATYCFYTELPAAGAQTVEV